MIQYDQLDKGIKFNIFSRSVSQVCKVKQIYNTLLWFFTSNVARVKYLFTYKIDEIVSNLIGK